PVRARHDGAGAEAVPSHGVPQEAGRLHRAVTVFLVVISAVYGLLIGSFLNAWAWRLAHGESISRGRSHCPACGHQIRAYDNVPVVSWLLLRGRCRDCGAPISPRY